MDADRRIIEIVEDDQGEGLVDPIDDISTLTPFEKALAKAIKEQSGVPEANPFLRSATRLKKI